MVKTNVNLPLQIFMELTFKGTTIFQKFVLNKPSPSALRHNVLNKPSALRHAVE